MKITIRNFDKLNPTRKDITKPTWFRLQNTIFSDPDMWEFDSDEKWIWVCLLCIASQKKSGTIDVHFKFLNKFTNIKVIKINDAIKKFNDIGWLTISRYKDGTQTVQESYATLHNSTLQTNSNAHSKKCATDFSLQIEELYKSSYPKKMGKTRGMPVIRKKITSEEKFQDFKKAVENYAKWCKNQSTEIKYIKLFSTFVNEFEDWIVMPEEPSTGSRPIQDIIADSEAEDRKFGL